MAQEIINIGALPNDGSGDPLRVAFQKINNNFSQLFATDYATYEAYSVGLTPGQVIFETPVANFTQAVFQIDSSRTDNQDSQNITINAAIVNNLSTVKWNGHSTLFNGNCVTRYDMDVYGGNVRLLVNPLQDTVLFHFINAQITWTGGNVPGVPLQLDGYTPVSVLDTENGLDITTEQ